MKIDIFNHIFPQNYFDEYIAGPKALPDIGKRVRNMPTIVNLDARFKVMDEFALELDAFAEAIHRKRDPEPDGNEGMRDVVVMQAIYRAARENRPVPINVPYAVPA